MAASLPQYARPMDHHRAVTPKIQSVLDESVHFPIRAS